MYGIVGLVLSSFIIAYILYLVLNIIRKYNISNYEEYLKIIFKNNKFLCYLNENIITVFLLLSFYIMELGFVNLLYQQCDINKYISMVIVTILSYIVLRGNVKSVIKTNMILIPFLMLAMMYISITGISKFGIEKIDLHAEPNKMFIVNAILYSSYNLIMLLPLITCLSERKNIKNAPKIISIIIFFIILVSGLGILLLLNVVNVQNVEIPIIYIANHIGGNTVTFSMILVLLAIFTSVICVGYSFLNNISTAKKKYKRNLFIMIITSFLLVNFSFASTMQMIYTLLGVIGIVQILAIILANFRKN